MRDNQETSPDLIQTRRKAGRNQFDLNVELALSTKASVSSGTVNTQAGATPTTTSVVVSGGSGGGGWTGGDTGDGIERCFLGSTLITLSNGHQVPIHMINPKDYILVPQPNGDVKPGKVYHKQISLAKEWLQICVAGKWVNVKPNHRFRARNGQWVEIAHLNEVIQRVDGRWELVPIDEKRVQITEHEALFYNFGVEDPVHAYIAADCWVSNAKRQPVEDIIL